MEQNFSSDRIEKFPEKQTLFLLNNTDDMSRL